MDELQEIRINTRCVYAEWAICRGWTKCFVGKCEEIVNLTQRTREPVSR